MYFVLENKDIREVKSVLTWAQNINQLNLSIGFTRIGETIVSTYYLGLNHSDNIYRGEPVIFETTIYTNTALQFARYSDYEEAEEGHQEACKFVQRGINQAKFLYN